MEREFVHNFNTELNQNNPTSGITTLQWSGLVDSTGAKILPLTGSSGLDLGIFIYEKFTYFCYRLECLPKKNFDDEYQYKLSAV